MIGDLSENPKWRWPSWTDPTPPPRQQQDLNNVKSYGDNSYQWPFIGGAFKPSPPQDIKERLVKMGVRFEEEAEEQLPDDFELMDDRQVRRQGQNLHAVRDAEKMSGRQVT
jgi:hypothetical protein